jgi:hypothetical protein
VVSGTAPINTGETGALKPLPMVPLAPDKDYQAPADPRF